MIKIVASKALHQAVNTATHLSGAHSYSKDTCLD